MRTWLKGLIVGLILSLPLIYYFITGIIELNKKPEGWGMIYTGLWWSASITIGLLMLSTLIGWIIGKIKNRKVE